MGRGTSNNAGSVFLHIADGKIVEKVSPDYPGAVKRINKKGGEVYERLDDFVEGVITSMYEKSNEYNGNEIKELCVRIQSDGESYTLSLGDGSRYWSSFAMRLPNLDLKKPVKFSPYSFTDKTTGKDVIGMNLFQGETKISPKFTKENPGNMPQGKVVQYKGEDKWDFYERDQFLLKVIRYFAGQLQQEAEAMGGEHGAPVKQTVTNDPPAAYTQSGGTGTNKPLPTNPGAGAVYQGVDVPGNGIGSDDVPF